MPENSTAPNVAVVGLAVMGTNLALNIESRGNVVAVYNRTGSVTEEFLSENNDARFVAAFSPKELVEKMSSPRQIILMIKSGSPVDAVIDQLAPLLEKGDMIIDGGNAFYRDTQRRVGDLKEKGIEFVGLGISGGEEGARHGPSLMPGCTKEAWKTLQPLLESIAADADGEPCTAYLGTDGVGHFVKMVHNGIEYADMQLIAESYDVLRRGAGMEPGEIASLFEEWNQGELESYLLEITAQILKVKDPEGEGLLLDAILDKAKQKGTGLWTVQEGFDYGVPVPTLSAAVTARVMSSMKDERVKAEGLLSSLKTEGKVDCGPETIAEALYLSRIVAYAQGLALIATAARENGWELNLSEVAKLWRNGCIIRARLLSVISDAFDRSGDLPNLLTAPALTERISKAAPHLRQFAAAAAQGGVPCPAHMTALAYLESYRTSRLPQNLTQAQRDFFGAHTYERVDREGTHHTEWLEQLQ